MRQRDRRERERKRGMPSSLPFVINHTEHCGRGLHKGANTRRQGSLGAFLEVAGYHKPYTVCQLILPVFKLYINGIILHYSFAMFFMQCVSKILSCCV